MHPTTINRSIIELNKTILHALDEKNKLLAKRSTPSVRSTIASIDREITKNKKYIESLRTPNLPWTPSGNYDRFMEINKNIGNIARDRLSLARLKKTSTRADKINSLTKQIKSLERERTDIIRDALDFRQRVTVKFNFVSIDPNGKEHPWPPVVKHGIGHNVDTVIANIKQELAGALEVYGHMVDNGNLISALHKIFVGQDRSNRTLVTSEDGPWNSIEVSVTPYYDAIPNMLVNANKPVEISGLRSIDNRFGCHVGAIKHFCKNTNDVEIQRQFATITGGIAITEDTGEAIDIEYDFDDEYIGITTEQFIEYLTKYFGNKNWTVGSILGSRIRHEGTKGKPFKHFTLVNNHVYVGVPKRKQINVKGKTDSVIKILNEDDLIAAMGSENMLYYVDDLNIVYKAIRTKYNTLADITCNSNGINMIGFRSNVFVDYDDYNERKAMYEKLSLTYDKSHTFITGFKNHSWSTLALAELSARGVTLYESFDIFDTREKLRQYKSKPFIGFINNAALSDESLRCYDLKKCYVQVCIQHALGRVGVYTADDVFHEVTDDNRLELLELLLDDDNIYVGELILDSFTYLDIPIPAMTWPSYFVKYMIESDIIDGHEIMYQRRAHEYDTMESLANYVKHIISHHGDHGKFMYTRLFGMLGVNTSTDYDSFVTTDIALSATSIDHGYSSSNISDGLFLSTKRSEKQILENYNPYFRFIVCGSVIKLFELATGIMNVAPKCNLLSARIDGIYVENVTTSEEIAIKEFLTTPWGFDDHMFVFGQSEVVKPHCVIRKPALIEPYEPVFENLTTDNKQLVLADAGLGKTRYIASIVKHLKGKILLTTFTNMLKKDLKLIAADNKDKNIKVINFNQLLIRYRKGKLRDSFDHIIVDEISTCGHQSLIPIIHLINKNPSCSVIFSGDLKQLGSVGERDVDYSQDAFTSLFGVHHKLQWKDGHDDNGKKLCRHDKKTYDALTDFCSNRMLNEALLDRIVTSYDKPCLNNIAARKKMCKQVSDKQIKLHKAAGMIIDKPWYNTVNTKDRINGDIFSDEEVKSRKIPTDDLVHVSCLTNYRVQGRTMLGDVVIYQADLMSWKGLYSAMARCTSLDNLYIIGDKVSLALKIWEDHEPIWKTKRACESSMKHYAVYLITDAPKSQLYVGITSCDDFSTEGIRKGINKRLEEHKLVKDFSNEVKIVEICHLMARENSSSIESAETHWIRHYQRECKNDQSIYMGWKIMNKLLLEKEEQVEDTFEPEVAPVAPVEQVIDELFTNHAIALAMFNLPQIQVTDKSITWRYDRAGIDVEYTKTKFKSVKKVRIDNTVEATKVVVGKIVQWIKTKGSEIDSIKDKLIEMNLL